METTNHTAPDNAHGRSWEAWVERLDLTGAQYIEGRLTTEHAASSYGLPVFVDEDGEALGPSDIDGGLVVKSVEAYELTRRAGYDIVRLQRNGSALGRYAEEDR